MLPVVSVIPIRLSDEELRKVYKDGRASNVRFSKEDGGGSMGSLNMAHQLHCLVRISCAMLSVYIDFRTLSKGLYEAIYIR